MRRTLWATTALLAGAAVVVVGPQAEGQAQFPVYAGVTVTPTILTSPSETVTVRGPAFPGVGCRPGTILAAPGGRFTDALVVATGLDLNTATESGDLWSVSFVGRDVPLAVGAYTIYLGCNETDSQTYLTTAQFSVTATATTTPTVATTSTSGVTTETMTAGSTPTTTTTTAPTGGQGTVEPSTVKPGVDTLTIRGGGFKAAAPLQITLGTTPVTAVGTTTATATGAYAATVKLPASAPPGNQQLVVTGPGPDDVSRSTTASLTVQDLNCSDFASPTAAQAGLGAGGADPHGLDADRDGRACQTVRAQSATGSSGTPAKAAGGSLPATGSGRTSYGLVTGLAAMTLGALLVGLSHPAVPATGVQHRRRRRGNHFR